jgi:Tape measure protein
MADTIIQERYRLDFDATQATENIIALAIETDRLRTAVDKAKAGSKSFEKAVVDLARSEEQLAKALAQEVTTYDAIVAKRKLAQLALETLTKGTAQYAAITKQATELEKREINTLDGLNAKINELRVKRGQLEFGTTAYKNTLKELTVLEARAAKETGGLAKSSGSFINALKGGVAALGVGLGAAEIINTTRQFEKLFATLKQATGSQGAASKIFSEIKEFAKETPFQLNEVVGAFVKLENRNFNPTIAQLRALGDIASSQGKSLDQFVEAVLDAQTGEFERLKEFGIVARKNGENVTLSFRGQATTIKNTSDNITKYLLELSKLPGIQGSAVAVAKTLDGSLSNLVDNFSQLAASIGGSGGVLKDVVDLVNSLVSAINDLIEVPLSESIREEKSEFNGLVGALQDSNVSTDEKNRLLVKLKAEYPQYLKFVGDDAKGQLDIAKTLAFGNELFEKRILLQATEEDRAKFTQEKLKAEQELTKELVKRQQFIDKGVQATSNRDIAGRAGLGAGVQGLFSEEDAARVAQDRVEILRNIISGSQKSIDDLLKTSNDTSSRLFNKTLAGLEAEINGIFGKESTTPPILPKAPGEINAVKGSLSELGEQLSKLRERLTKFTVADDKKALEPLLIQIAQLEDRIKQAKKLQDELLARPFAEFKELPTKDVQAAQIAIEQQRARIQEQAIKEESSNRLRAIEDEQGAALESANLTAAEKTNIEAQFQAKRQQLAIETDRALTANAIRQKQLELLELERTAAKTKDGNPEGIAKIRAELAALQAQLAALQNKDVKLNIDVDKDGKVKNELKEIADAAVSLGKQVADTLQSIFDRQAERADAAVERQRSKLNDALSNSEDFSAKQIEIERARLDQFQKEQERAAQRAKALQVAQVIANTIIAISKAAGQTGVGAPIAIISTLAAIAAGIAAASALADNSFYGGTDFVPLGNNPKGRDTVPARLHEGEGVLQADKNKAYSPTFKAMRRGQIPADVLNGFVESWKGGTQMSMPRTRRLSLPDSVTGVNAGGNQNFYFNAKLNTLEREAATQTNLLKRIEINGRGNTSRQIIKAEIKPERFV